MFQIKKDIQKHFSHFLFYDFDKKQYKNVYENSKKIIEDILVFDKERETELQIIKESMYELNTMDTFNSGPFYNDADEDF